MDMQDIRTQKAKGVAYLARQMVAPVPPFRVTRSEEEVQDAFNYLKYYAGNYGSNKLFARPCPVRPRHGFVDSRPVGTAEEACTVLREAIAADPDAEMMLMPAIKAAQSAILTPAAVSVGAGHDGVTGKGDRVVTFPLASVNFEWLDRDEARITDAPYIESVQQSNGDALVVQLRDGPSVSSVNADAYVTEKTTVREVWTADGDLLAWEDRVRNAPTGVVVWQPGGSMLSHYAVHAVLRGLPILFTPEPPRVGDILRPTVKAAKVDYFSVLRGLAYGLKQPLTGHGRESACGDPDCEDCGYSADLTPARRALRSAVVAAHQASAYMTSPDGAIALGHAVGAMLRCSTAACLGETRYHGGTKKYLETKGRTRDVIYKAALEDYGTHRIMLRAAYDCFMDGSWSKSYGGPKWGNVTQATIALDRAALQFSRKQGKRRFNDMLAALHTLLNAVHNGGSWTNKFIESGALDRAASGDLGSILRGAYAARPIVLAARELGTVKVLPGAKPVTIECKVPAPKKRKFHVQIRLFMDRNGAHHWRIQYGYTNSAIERSGAFVSSVDWRTVNAALADAPREQSFKSSNTSYVKVTPAIRKEFPTWLREEIDAIEAQRIEE